MPQISVIIPVYKAEKYLAACLQSVLGQTFADFEVLLIDDDSPDACPTLCDAWAKKDPRIRVQHLKNTATGPSQARNAGLALAKGEYLTFVDSDDTVEPDYLARLLAGAKATGALWVMCNSRPVSEAGEPLPFDAAQTFAADTLLDEEAFWNLFNTPKINLFTGTAHKLYAAALFQNVCYPVGMLNEDYYIVPDLMAQSHGLYCLAYFGYNVVQHAGSITETARHEVRLYQTMGDIHRAEYFLSRGWYDRAEGALTDAAEFLYRNKKAFDVTQPGHRRQFAAAKAALCRVYSALAAQKGSTPLQIKAAALRLGLPVYAAWCRITKAL